MDTFLNAANMVAADDTEKFFTITKTQLTSMLAYAEVYKYPEFALTVRNMIEYAVPDLAMSLGYSEWLKKCHVESISISGKMYYELLNQLEDFLAGHRMVQTNVEDLLNYWMAKGLMIAG